MNGNPRNLLLFAILLRSSACCMTELQCGLFPRMRGNNRRGLRMRHGSRDSFLFFWCQLEDVVGQKLTVIAGESVKRRRSRSREYPLIVLLLE